MKKKLIIVLISAITCIALAITVYAAQAGSADDPLVSKSYVDDKINQVLQVLNSNASNANNANNANNNATSPTLSQEEKNKLKAEIIAELGVENEQSPSSVASEGYKPVFVKVGQTILGGEGTEMILRSGKATVYITGVAGIVNATTGKELVNGNKATWNNIMIIPRNDGRGFKVTEEAWFLVKGDYEIK